MTGTFGIASRDACSITSLLNDVITPFSGCLMETNKCRLSCGRFTMLIELFVFHCSASAFVAGG